MSKKVESKIATYVLISKTAPNKSGEVPVVIKITDHEKNNVFIRTGITIHPENWDSARCRILGRDAQTKRMNLTIDDFVYRIDDHYQQLKSKGAIISAKNIRNSLLGKSPHACNTILEIWDQQLETMTKLIGKDYVAATVRHYKVHRKILSEFINKEYGVKDIPVVQINYDFLDRFSNFIKLERNYSQNSACKVLRNFKKIISYCIKKELITTNPFVDFKLNFVEVERPYLTSEELIQLKNINLTSNSLSKVRDIFIFSCYTGLAYIDVQKLTKKDIEISNGIFRISMRRQKTKTRFNIPLLDCAKNIIDKYVVTEVLSDDDPILPVISNQKMNNYLKVITKKLGWTKDVSFHTARHTFATTVTLTNGVPIESVSKMLGHKSIKTTQIYARVVDKKIEEDMLILANRLNSTLANSNQKSA